jgi:lipopolysaccharide/colanic/teichoic acid biosynthesis glycosyltransferase
MPKTPAWRFLVGSLVLLDAGFVLLGLNLAAWLAAHPVFGSRGTPGWGFILLMLPVFALIFVAQGLYDPAKLLGGTREYEAVFRACTYGLVAMVLVSFVSRRIVSREWIVVSWACTAVLVGTGRFLVRRAAYRLRRRGHLTANTIMVGADAHSLAVATQLSQNGSGVRIVGFLDDYVPAGSVLANGHRVLGGSAALMQIAARTHADEAILVPQALPWETLQTLLTNAAGAPNGLRVHLPAGFYDLLTTRVGLSERNHVPLLTVMKARLTPLEAIVKWSLDYAISILLLISLSPVILFTALKLRLSGDGRVFDRDRVIGQYGREFILYSFRAATSTRSAFVRKLPGVINVLRGELSIVGPRPTNGRPDDAHAKLLSIRPGLTGSWRQVSDKDEQAILDLYYIRSYSIWLDLQVLFQRLRARFG